MFGAGDIVPIAFLLSVAFTLVGLTKTISDGRTRRRLIDAGAAPELARVIAGAPKEDPGLFGTLKWGIVTGTVGVGLIVVQFLPYRPDEPIVLGLLLVFTAAGLLAYYASARRLLRPTKSAGTV